MDKAIDVN